MTVNNLLYYFITFHRPLPANSMATTHTTTSLWRPLRITSASVSSVMERGRLAGSVPRVMTMGVRLPPVIFYYVRTFLVIGECRRDARAPRFRLQR